MSSAPPITAYRGRVRTGCLTCRSRKIKCDEGKPVCKNCTRVQRSCTYKPGRNVQHDSSSPTNIRFARDPSPLEVSYASPSGLPITPRSDDAQLGDARPGGSTPSSNIQTSSHSPEESLVDTALRLRVALQAHGDSALPPLASPVNDDLPLELISRDIQLTTTMDYLAARDEGLELYLNYFLETVECPGITPFDSINWSLMKQHVVEIGRSCPAVNAGIRAVSAVYKAQIYAISSSRALLFYDSAKSSLRDVLNDQSQSFSTVLPIIFLLCMFELIHSGEIVPHLKELETLVLEILRISAQVPSTHTDLSSRLVVWLKIIHAITMRGGGQGLIPDSIFHLLPNYEGSILNLKPLSNQRTDLSTHLLEVLYAPLFDFYYRLQTISGEIAHLTHYHRSRNTGTDQKDVIKGLRAIKDKLQCLWNDRCATHYQPPAELRLQLAPGIANHIISLIDILNAAYQVEIVELDRVLGDPVTKGAESRDSMRAIREIVDSNLMGEETDVTKILSPAYIRPLFLYAIECMDREENLWAVERMKSIRSPIYRSDFFAAFGKALSDAQLVKDRRVTSKYFCIYHFGFPPPFL